MPGIGGPWWAPGTAPPRSGPNFPQSRITDHRINLSVHNLSDVLNGGLDEMVTALRMASRQELVDA